MQDNDRQTIVSINGKEIVVPTYWNDLNSAQVMKSYAALLNPRIETFFQADEALEIRRQELMKIVLNLDEKFMDRWKEDAGEDFYNELKVLSHLASGFAFENANEDGAIQIKLNLTKNPFPTLPFEEEAYCGPSDELANITLYELGLSFLAFERFMESGAEEDAAELIAILYRPCKPDTVGNIRSGYEGDQRLPIYKHESTIKARAKIFKDRLPIVVRQVTVFWFTCCRMNIINSFPNLFDNDGPQKDPESNDYSWAGVILNLAGGLVNEEAVSNKNWGTAFTYLSMLEDQRKEAEFKAMLKPSK